MYDVQSCGEREIALCAMFERSVSKNVSITARGDPLDAASDLAFQLHGLSSL